MVVRLAATVIAGWPARAIDASVKTAAPDTWYPKKCDA
jgi:hypothetical protein